MAGTTPQMNPSVPHLQPNATVANLLGHEYAVRRVSWSPHHSNRLASASYDMTCRLWTTDVPNEGRGAGVSQFMSQGGMGGRMDRVWDGHKEFVVGCAWSLYEEGLMASCSWDQEVHLWR